MMKRIAIYARKSVVSDKGESIKTQVNKCKEFIKLKYGDEEISYNVYDQDEGFTGANTHRPDFQRMLRHIEQGNIDVLICYKLDRMSRSVADCANTVKMLEKHGVIFYSATESFETATPIGRAMMGMAMVFAQLERETIAERITDSMYELAKTDRWIGGKPPLGYKRQRVKIAGTKKEQTIIVVDEITAPHAQMIFNKYVEFRSISKLETYLLQNHIKSQNGKDLGITQIALILKNPVYVKADERVKDFYISRGVQFHGDINDECGLLTYGKTKGLITEEGKQGLERNTMDKWIVAAGSHPGIVDADVWLEAQRILKENFVKFPRIQKSHTALLSGMLRCSECSSSMYVGYGHKNEDGSRRSYYYACHMRQKSKNKRCSNKNARADLVDQAVKNEIMKMGIDKEKILGGLREELKQDNQEIVHNPVELIKREIKKKEEQANRLVERISLTDDNRIALMYEEQIKKLYREIATLSADLAVVGKKKTKVYQTQTAIAYIESILDRCGHIDELELEEQMELVRVLFKRIEWNAATESLKFYPNSYDDDGDDGGGGGFDNIGDNGDNGGGVDIIESIVTDYSNDMSHIPTSIKRPARLYRGTLTPR